MELGGLPHLTLLEFLPLEKSPTSWDSRFFSFLFSSCSLSWVPGTPYALCKEAGPPSQTIFQTLTSQLPQGSLQKNSYANTTACLYFHTLIFRLGYTLFSQLIHTAWRDEMT